jgi:peptidoglycan/LPS O-acetylase OafA/YrhL
VTQVVASFAAKAAPGASLIGVAAIFAVSAVLVVAVGLTYYVLIERRFMTRNWHLLAWAAVKRSIGRETAPASADSRPKLVASRETRPKVAAHGAALRRSVGRD